MLKHLPPKHGWSHLITVEVSLRCVDPRSGVDGHPRETCLATFVAAPEHHRLVDIDLLDLTP